MSPVTARAWTPVLDRALASRAMEAVDAIADALSKAPTPDDAVVDDDRVIDGASLANGHAGVAVLFAYLAHARLGKGAAATAEALLEAAIHTIAERRAPPYLYQGFTGVAWAAIHLGNLNQEQQDEDLTEVVDDALREYLTRTGWKDDYDLVSGLVGIGVYALERLPSPAGRDLLSLVVDRLDDCAERRERGVTWLTSPELLPESLRATCPGGHYNLGMAHGVPGAIAVLGAAVGTRIAQSKARPLLEGAVEWLLSHEASGDARPAFSSWITPDGEVSGRRLAWCYGSPGIAASLFAAGRWAGEPAWQRKAIDIARHAAACPQDETGVRDAGVCHGAAGLAHIFNRLYHTSGDAQLAEAARSWFARTLDMLPPPHAVIDSDVYGPGLLTGAAGIALALLAAVTPIEPAWDRMLLLSMVPN